MEFPGYDVEMIYVKREEAKWWEAISDTLMDDTEQGRRNGMKRAGI